MLNKHNPIIAHGVEKVTGSKVIFDHGLRKVVSVTANVHTDAAADANKAASVTVKIADDGLSFSINCWKSKAAGDTELVAATAEVSVQYTAIGE